jgi:hypothetical protein
MKKLFFLLFVALTSLTNLSAQDDAITRYFSKYMEDDRFTVVYISPKMFDLVSKISTNDPDWEKTREVVRDLKGLRVLVADSIPNGMQLYNEAMKTIPVREYEELITVRDKGENVRIMTKESGGIISELLLLVGEKNQFVMLSFAGKIDLDKISRLAQTLDVEGADQLEKIKAKKN